MKICQTCKEIMPLFEFYRNGPYFRNVCKSCYNKRRERPKAKPHTRKITKSICQRIAEACE